MPCTHQYCCLWHKLQLSSQVHIRKPFQARYRELRYKALKLNSNLFPLMFIQSKRQQAFSALSTSIRLHAHKHCITWMPCQPPWASLGIRHWGAPCVPLQHGSMGPSERFIRPSQCLTSVATRQLRKAKGASQRLSIN